MFWLQTIEYKIIIIIFFIFILLFKCFIELYRYQNLKQIKICICTCGKQENRYIKEYIEYYKKYGIDKIILYDNNNLNDENFEDIIKKYINKEKFKNCENIQLNWLLYTDNNLIHYQNKPLKIRFTEKDPYRNKRKINKFSNGKSILRGHIPNINITNFHCISNDLKTCDGFGIERKFLKPDYKYFYFKHYYCKSTEEFIDKLIKGDIYETKNKDKIKFYFSYNKITKEKLNYIEKRIGENLKYYKYKLNLTKNLK